MNSERLSTPKILLVDDEIQQLWLRAEVMRLRGFSVLTADNPDGAISLVSEKASANIDLVVIDYNMPGMNGCDLADLLKVICPELRIILYSGESDIPRTEMTSIDVFVSKSDGMSTLIVEIARLTQTGPAPPVTTAPATKLHSLSRTQAG
jgi:DNA-binding NtrC family response regulator